MLMVYPVNISIGVHPYFTEEREYIFASQTIPKPHMSFGTLPRIILRVAFPLSIFIIPLDMFFQG